MTDDRLHIPIPNVSGWIHRAYVLRQQLETALDGAFEDAPVPAGTSIVLYNEVDAGLGDIAFATKLLRLLHAAMPTCELILASTGLAKQERFGRPEGVTIYGVDEFAKLTTHRTPTLVISAPGNFDHCRSREAVLAALAVDPATPFVYLAEYGSLRYLRNDDFKGLMPALDAFVETYMDEVAQKAGVSSDDIGHRASTGDILCAEDGKRPYPIGNILEGLVSLRPDNPLRDFMTQPLLAARGCGLDVGEVGIHIDEALTAEALEIERDPAARAAQVAAIEHPVLGAHLRHVASTTPDAALYAGYARTGYDRFLDYVSITESGATRDVELILPIPRTPQELHDAFVNDALVARLRTRGVGTLTFLGYTEAGLVPADPTPVSVTTTIAPSGKHLRVVSFFPLPYRDMRRLLLATEPATLVSGDQSFSDAISANKAILYIEPVYCQAYHVDAVAAIASRVAPDAQTLLAFGMRSIWSEEGYDAIIRILSAPDAMAPFRAFGAEVRAHHNANRPLTAIVKRQLLSHADPAVAARVAAQIHAAIRDFTVAEGFTLPTAALRLLSPNAGRLG